MALSRPMLRDQIKDAIVERILNGDYAPGERIVEIRVAQEFGVSQAPVREALRELELLRLVVSEPFRGARVREVTAGGLAEIYPVRGALEGGAAGAGTPGGAARGRPPPPAHPCPARPHRAAGGRDRGHARDRRPRGRPRVHRPRRRL